MSLQVEISGSGDDLVLIHGWGMHGGIWEGVREALSKRHRLHVVDLPGMGYSPPCTPYDLPHLAQKITQVTPLGAQVCGWSLGGLVALQMALDDPPRVRRLLLVGGTPRFVNSVDWPYGIEGAVFCQFAADVTADYEGTMTRFLSLQALGGEASREQTRMLRERFASRPPPRQQALQAALKILLHTDLRAALPRLTMPVLLLHGERDTLAPVAAARWMATQIAGARLIEINGASHAPFLSHPAAFVNHLEQFLQS